MLPSESPEPSAAPVAGPASLSPVQRAIATFTRPGVAWEGLKERGQWWIPYLVVLIVTVAGYAIIYQRAQLPTILDAIEARDARAAETSARRHIRKTMSALHSQLEPGTDRA